jgi:hypothetical protein
VSLKVPQRRTLPVAIQFLPRLEFGNETVVVERVARPRQDQPGFLARLPKARERVERRYLAALAALGAGSPGAPIPANKSASDNVDCLLS